jgi:DNA-binding transcriptional LysR family regulator
VLLVDGALSGKDLKPSGALRVTAIDNMATTVLMPMFGGFAREYPDVTLHIMVSNSDVSLAQREADVAIRLTNTPPDTLIGKRVVTVSSAIYGSRGAIWGQSQNSFLARFFRSFSKFSL